MSADRGPMTPLMYRVRERIVELDDTVTVTLEPIAESIETPAPGQFNMLWAFGIGEAPISVARLAGDGTFVHTIRAVGSVTRALCALQPGEQVGVRGPFGSRWPLTSAEGEDVLVVAGGLGLAPVRPIIDHVLGHRDHFGKCTLFVGARSPELLIYATELDRLRHDERIDVEIIVDTAGPTWTGQVGLITKLIANATLNADRTHAFVCGPEPMMRFGAIALLDQGVAGEHIWLSLERNMHCAIGHCGHCQLGALFICRDGPILAWPSVGQLIRIPER